MDFRILGPVEATAGGEPLRLGGPRQRALLAYLLLHANDAVAAERLLDELWAEPPGGGLAALQTQVSRLRRVLDDRIITAGSGYAIRVEPGELDLDRFRSLLADAGAAASPRDRSHLLREADAVWRGAPLAGLDVPFAAGEAAALEELRVAAIEDRIEADLESGLDSELVSELSVLVARYPLRERLRGELILALYRAGRQADALEAYRETRRMLDEELGLEPSPPLRKLEHAILQQDPSLVAVPTAASAAATAPEAPERRALLRWRSLVLAGAALLVVAAAGAATVVFAVGSGSVRVESTRTVIESTSAVQTGAKRMSIRHKSIRHNTHASGRTRIGHTAPPAVVPRIVVRVVTTTATPKTPSAAAGTTTAKKTTPPPATSTATTTQPTATTAAQSVQISDDFSSPTIDSLTWTSWESGTGATASQRDGRLVFAIPGGAGFESRWNSVSTNYGTKCKFTGDFDARVDYALLTWPHNEGATVSLVVFQSGPVDEVSRQTSSAYGDFYTSWPGGGSAPLADTSGTLRIARSNGVVRTYILHNGKWRTLDAEPIDGELWVGMTLISFSTDWQQSDVSAAFDNFVLTAPDADCPTGSDPRAP